MKPVLPPIILILGLAFAFGPAHAADAPASVAELFVTPENLQLLRRADQVDVCVLRHIPPAPRADGSIDRRVERYEETTFVPVGPAVARTLRELLLSGQTYDWKAGSGGRRPQFYLRLRFRHGADLLAIDFCFLCHVLNVTRDGAELAHANFDRNADLFLRTFLQVFPDDGPLRQVAKEAGLEP